MVLFILFLSKGFMADFALKAWLLAVRDHMSGSSESSCVGLVATWVRTVIEISKHDDGD